MKHKILNTVVKTVFLLSLTMTNLTGMASNHVVQSDDSDTMCYQEVLEVCEEKPEFPGGWAALLEYLQENLVYPEEAAEGNIQGKVIVQFIVDSVGNIGNVKVVRPVHELLDAEAIRVVKTFPQFSPGRQDGKPVNVLYTLPVNFKLFSEEEEVHSEDTVQAEKKYNTQAIGDFFEFPEKMPEFPGGEMALMNFLRRNLRYPQRAAIRKVEGRVVVQFVVDEKGAVSEIKVAESVDKDLDNEAMRICRMLPKFSPALLHGEPIKVWYTLPITFRIPRNPDRDF